MMKKVCVTGFLKMFFLFIHLQLDAKKSPLALLAQTCSQIGADTPSTKSLLPSLHSSSDSSKRKSSCSSETSSNSHGSESHRDGSQSSSTSSRPRSNGGMKSSASTGGGGGGKSSPPFKPYESTSSSSSTSSSLSVTTISSSSCHPSSTRANNNNKSDEEKPKTPKSSTSSPGAGVEGSKNSRSRTTSPAASSAGGSSGSAVVTNNAEVSPSKSEPSRESKSSSDSGKASPSGSVKDQGASPIIRSGIEVLHGHLGGGKDLRDYGKPGLSSLSALAGYPPGFDPTNPALRPPFFPSPSHHAAAAAAFMGYPPATGTGSPYVGYTRVKTPSGAETIVPVCKDPYCTGCQLGMPAGLMAAAAAAGQLGAYPSAVCPAGCVQCDHQKFAIGLPFMPHPGLGGIPTSTAAALASYSSSLLSQHQQAVQQHQQQQHQQQQQQQQQAAAAAAQRPYVCNWIVGDSYCGKRFPSSEELLQHLRTHTNLSSTEAQQMSMSSPSSLYSSALLNSSAAAAAAAAAAAMHRTYPTPPLSPLSAARYHPYASGKPLSSLVPPHPPSLGSYYPSPYSLYGQRIGPPVHP